MAVYFDLKIFKIPNRLSYVGWGLGVIYSFVTIGIKGLFFSIVWILVPIAILFLLFCFGFLGAGDIKLYSFIGSIIFSDVIKVIVVSMCFCGVYGVFLVLKKLIQKKLEKNPTVTHYSVFILLGTIIYFLVGEMYGF